MKFWSSIKFWGALFSPKSNLWPTCVSGLTRNKTISLMSQSAAKWLTFFHLACSLFTHAFGMAWNPFTDSCRSIFPKRGSQNWIAGKNPTLHLVVSWNRATPSSHPFIDGIFHYRPTIVGYPHDYGKPHVGWKKHPAAVASAPGWCDHRDLCALLLWKWLVRDPSCRLSSVGSELNWYTYSYTKNVYVYACAYV